MIHLDIAAYATEGRRRGNRTVHAVANNAVDLTSRAVFRRVRDFIPDRMTTIAAPAGDLPAHMIRRADVPAFLHDSVLRWTVLHNTSDEGVKGIVATGPQWEFTRNGMFGDGIYGSVDPWFGRNERLELALRLRNPLVGTAAEIRNARADIIRGARMTADEQSAPGAVHDLFVRQGIDGVILFDDQTRGLMWAAGYVNENVKLVVDALPG